MHTHGHSLKCEKMNINHCYGKMLQAAPSLKMCVETGPTLKFNIASANLAKETRANDTEPLLSLDSGIRSLAGLQEVKAQSLRVGSSRVRGAPARSPCCGSLLRRSASRQRLTPAAHAQSRYAVNAPSSLDASMLPPCVCVRVCARARLRAVPVNPEPKSVPHLNISSPFPKL